MIFEKKIIDNFRKENLMYTLKMLSLIAFVWVSFYLGFIINPEYHGLIFGVFVIKVSGLKLILALLIQLLLFAFSFVILYYLSLFFLIIIASINFFHYWSLHKLKNSFPKIEYQPCMDTAIYYYLILCFINLIISINTKTPLILSFINNLLSDGSNM